VEDGPCVTYIGPGGAGHFVKTVHNGIEYGIEQILAEAYDLMKRCAGMDGDAMAAVLGQWNATEELSSFIPQAWHLLGGRPPLLRGSANRARGLLPVACRDRRSATWHTCPSRRAFRTVGSLAAV
jgi:hypothetical protein